VDFDPDLGPLGCPDLGDCELFGNCERAEVEKKAAMERAGRLNGKDFQ